MSNQIWIDNPKILIESPFYEEIWPTSNMEINQKINAFTRLVILLTIIGFLATLSFRILCVGIITLVLIIILYYVSNKMDLNTKEGFDLQDSLNLHGLPGVYPSYTNPEDYEKLEDLYTKPCPQNPAMNVLIPEIYYDPNRKPAAPSFNPKVDKEITDSVKTFTEKPFKDKYIDERLFNDLGDAFTLNRSMHTWYSMPNTEVPNNQGGFAEFLYGSMISGKEGNPYGLVKDISLGGAYNYTFY